MKLPHIKNIKIRPQHWIIGAVVVLIIALAIYYSLATKKAETDIQDTAKKQKGNQRLRQQFENYDSLSYSEQKALWAIVYDKCPHYKAAIRQQMKKWGRSYPEQLAKEVDWALGGNPAGVNRNALSEVTKKGRCPNFLETL